VGNHYVNNGRTVSICSLDLSKAFDKVNHHALFTKLMKRNIPNELLILPEKWLSNSWTCVKWDPIFSRFVKIDIGIRQWSVLSPQLFAIYLDDVASCLTIRQRYHIVLYADDILIIALSLTELQRLVNACESACMRVGPRYNVACSSIVAGNQNLPWVNKI